MLASRRRASVAIRASVEPLIRDGDRVMTSLHVGSGAGVPWPLSFGPSLYWRPEGANRFILCWHCRKADTNEGATMAELVRFEALDHGPHAHEFVGAEHGEIPFSVIL